MTKLIIDVTTGEELLRDLTAEEIAQQEIDTANEIAEAKALLAKHADKIAAKEALLERLGITEQEARLLLS